MRKRKWVDPFLKEENNYLIKDAKTYNNIYLEIGMGMGDFLVASAFNNPNNMYIGLEKDATCVARAIKKASELNVNNLKIIKADASNILELFNSNSLNTIYLHFSDPWPKKHHHKRRLTYKTFLDKYYLLLNDTGTIVFKTDNRLLFEDSIVYFNESKFTVIEINENYHAIYRDEPLTAYEKKFKDQGLPIYYVKLTK